MDELFDFIVARIMQHIGIEHTLGPQWQAGEIVPPPS
jgi:3-polyprenyl-4-hydroxybenzoate decarboxylase